jgi:hypothetical protein
MFRGEEIGSLENDEARQALVEHLKDGPITAADRVVTKVVKEVEGYPYFVQLWGAELWDSAVDAGSNKITASLLKATQQDIYRLRKGQYDYTAPKFRQYLLRRRSSGPRGTW